MLGNMQYAGRGVKKDYVEAVRWYRLAAERGYTDAMGRLAMMYHDGKGVSKNYKHAYAWAALALERASNKSEKDKYLPVAIHMAQELDSKEFEQAKQLKEKLSKTIRIFSE
jgi:TPR repeat protein